MIIIIICIAIVFGGFFYYLAVRSRKTYRCPECGESVQVEHMETARCGMCGSLLEEKEIRK